MASLCVDCAAKAEAQRHRTHQEEPSAPVGPPKQVVDQFGEPFEVRCPVCSEKILSTARKCKHCGEWSAGQAHALPITTAGGVHALGAEFSSELQTAGWVCAFLVPLVGVIIGIIALTKNAVGSGLGMIAVSGVMMFVWAAVLLG